MFFASYVQFAQFGFTFDGFFSTRAVRKVNVNKKFIKNIT